MTARRPVLVSFIFLAAALPTAATGAPDGARGGGPLPAGAAAGRACEIPVLWRVDGVDPRFGITEAEAVGAVREAALLWERALGRILVFRESGDGIPIRFVYDERQEATRARQARMAELDAEARAIEESERRLEALRSRLASLRAVHEARLATYRDRLDGYEEMVEFWNARGGAPAEEVERLRQLEAEVAGLRASASAAAEEVNGRIDALNGATGAHNREVERANRARQAFRDAFPVGIVQSGEYVESRRGLGGITFSRNAEIQIYEFVDRDHLVLVIAHELGHALGLGHTGVEGTLMAAENVAEPGMGPPEVMPGDVEALRELCPEL